MDPWPNLWLLLEKLGVQLDQRMLTAFRFCPKDRSIHDVHVLRALLRLNAAFVRHPYAATLGEGLRHMWDPGESVHSQTGQPLGGTVVPSLEASIRSAVRSGMISTNSFLSAWAANALADGSSHYRRSKFISALMGDADTHEGDICDVPDLEDFLEAQASLPHRADDIEYIVALEDERIIFRPVSVLDDYVQRGHSGLLVPQRTLLTHFKDAYGLFTSDQIEELEFLMNNPLAREAEFQAFFERNPHFLRCGDYREIYPQPYLRHKDVRSLIPDFILTDRALAKAAVVDLKLPGPKLIRRQANRERFSSAVLEARAQLLRYREWFRSEPNRRSLSEVVGMEIYEPHLMVIIGRSAEFQDAIDRQRLNADLCDVEVVTYDDIVTFARRRRISLQ